jgi:hypothetical protein
LISLLDIETARCQPCVDARHARSKPQPPPTNHPQRTGRWDPPEELLDATAVLSGGALGNGRSTPRRAGSARGGRSAPAGLRGSRQEAELQRVLEEEILLEMERERALASARNVEERRRLAAAFARERDAAKARILAAGSGLGPEL